MGETEGKEGSNGKRDGILEMKPRCKSCPFWEKAAQDQIGPRILKANSKDPDQGHCHLLPPQMIPIPLGPGQVNIQSMFAATMSDSWCSSHPDYEVPGA